MNTHVLFTAVLFYELDYHVEKFSITSSCFCVKFRTQRNVLQGVPSLQGLLSLLLGSFLSALFLLREVSIFFLFPKGIYDIYLNTVWWPVLVGVAVFAVLIFALFCTGENVPRWFLNLRNITSQKNANAQLPPLNSPGIRDPSWPLNAVLPVISRLLSLTPTILV